MGACSSFQPVHFVLLLLLLRDLRVLPRDHLLLLLVQLEETIKEVRPSGTLRAVPYMGHGPWLSIKCCAYASMLKMY
jgi:hypothetical protein